MLIYIINIILIVIYGVFIKNKKILVALTAFQLFLILALSSPILGVDNGNYSAGYEYINKLSFPELISRLNPSGVSNLVWPFYYENGYTILNWLASSLGLSFHGFLVVCFAINISSVSYFIYKYSKKPWLSFYVFCTLGFFQFEFGILRQMLSLSMVLLTYCCLDKRKYGLSGIFALLAFGFHRASIISIPLLLIMVFRKKNITKKLFAIMLAMTVLVLVLSPIIYNNILLPVMTDFNKGYSGHSLEINKRIFLYFGISIATLLLYDFDKIKERIDSMSCFALLFTVYFTCVTLYNDTLGRALPFYSIFILILIPNIFMQYKSQKAAVLIELAVCLLLGIYMCMVMSESTIVPYIVNDGGFL